MIGTVYKIEIYDKIYIGSTIMKLSGRQASHNRDYRKNIYKYKLYEECRKNNIENIVCIPLETIEIENDLEIRELEQEYIEKLKPSLNSYIAYTGLTKEEYMKERYERNKEENKERVREYMKEYSINNKEKLTEKSKKYYENNKEKIKQRQSEKIKCPICNSIVRSDGMKEHKRTKKCLNYSA